MTPKPNTVAKDTVYVDVEDDITAIIDKVNASSSKIVALVLPKRLVTLQSAVNLKLLKKAAASNKKSVVLITSDEAVLSLASVAGVHVAKTLQSKPTIPVSVAEGVDVEAPVGELDDALQDTADTIELDDQQVETPVAAEKTEAKKAGFKKPNIKIPDFNKFRKWVILGGVAVVLLIGGLIFALTALPKATITLQTDTSIFDIDEQFTASTTATEPDLEKNILPAIKKDVKKSVSEKVKTTGQRDEGTKATGTLTLTNCIDDDQPHTIPAGTGFSNGDITFVTNQAIELGPAVYVAGACQSSDPYIAQNFGTQKSIKATAIEGGEKYNVKAQAYNPPAAFVTTSGAVTAQGTDMKGGTTKIVKIVSQNDVEAAKQAALDELDKKATEELQTQLNSEQARPLQATFNKSEVQIKSEPAIGEKAEEANVTITLTYSQLGVKNEYLTSLIEDVSKDNIDPTKQIIQNTGLDQAALEIIDDKDKNKIKIALKTTVTAGPQLDEAAVKQEAAGKKSADAKQSLETRPGIISVDVDYSPFWVSVTPKDPNKIKVIFAQSNEAE